LSALPAGLQATHLDGSRRRPGPLPLPGSLSLPTSAELGPCRPRPPDADAAVLTDGNDLRIFPDRCSPPRPLMAKGWPVRACRKRCWTLGSTRNGIALLEVLEVLHPPFAPRPAGGPDREAARPGSRFLTASPGLWWSCMMVPSETLARMAWHAQEGQRLGKFPARQRRVAPCLLKTSE